MTHDDENPAEVQPTEASEASIEPTPVEDVAVQEETPLPETLLPTEGITAEEAPAASAEGSLSLSLTPWTDTGTATVAESAGTITAPPRRRISGGWTMALVLSGIGIIAACVLIPQGDQTRKLMYEREKLRADLEQVQKQVATNDEFLKQVQSDPTLAQRLAQRQMKLLPAGSKVLDVDDASPTKDDKSPFLIVSVPPPAQMPPYQPRGGWFSQKCREGRSQLYMIGGGLMLLAAGLVLGSSGERA